MGQCPLLSPSSALVFVREFSRWAAGESLSPAGLVAEGWDAGIGVWLGLAHSVRVLARALEIASRGGGDGRGGFSGVCAGGDGGGVAFGEREETCHNYNISSSTGPSAQAIALAVFELRSIVGTPSAALRVLNPFSPHAGKPPPPPAGERAPRKSLSAPASASAPTPTPTPAPAAFSALAENHPLSRRPPPGAMVSGFLKRMNERWKAHLEWGLPGTAPPRRTSARLERSRGSVRSRTGGGGDGETQSLRAEAEDLFFALRGELLRAERIALSIILVGPGATSAGRRWAMRAALISARRREERAVGGHWAVAGVVPPRPSGATTPAANATATTAAVTVGTATVGTAGALEAVSAARDRSTRSAMAAGAAQETGSDPARPSGSRKGLRRREGGGSTVGVKGGPATEVDVEAPGPRIATDTQQQSGNCDGGGGGSSRLTGGSGRRPDLDGIGGKAGCLNGGEEEGEWEGLGRLCLLAAKEMREGLENGLSVKLTQVWFVYVFILCVCRFRRWGVERRLRWQSVVSDDRGGKSVLSPFEAENENSSYTV